MATRAACLQLVRQYWTCWGKRNFHSVLFESKATGVGSPGHSMVNQKSGGLTLPWYLILSCCRRRKSRLLVLLLRAPQNPQLASHPRSPTSDRISSPQPLALFSLSLFLRVLLPSRHRPSLSPARTEALSSGPNPNSLSPLFTPSICLLFDSSSKCPPLLPSRLQELLFHVTPVGKEKKQGEAVE